MFLCIKPYRRQLLLAILLMVVDVLAEVLQPTLMADIIGPGIQGGNISYIIKVGAAMIGVALVGLLAGCGNSIFSAKAGVGFAAELRDKLFRKVQTFSFHNIDTFSTASLSIRLTNDVTQMQNLAVMCTRMMIRAPLMLPFALIMAIQVSGKLALILCVAIPLLVVTLAFMIRAAMPRFKKMQQAIDNLNRTVQENVVNMRVVKSFVRQSREKEKFQQASEEQRNAAMHAMYVVITAMPLMMLVMNGTIVAVVLFGGKQIIENTLTVAEMTKFINYIMQVLMSLLMFAMMFMMVTRASASYQRVIEVLKTNSDLMDTPDAVSAAALSGCVEFRDVSFQYDPDDDGEPVLSHINFQISPGKTIAVIGGTGAGKTSLVQLIPRLYETTSGDVLLDGISVKQYTLSTLHDNISVVLQNNMLFTGTIRDNLRWGDDTATDAEIERAARAAQAHDFIMSFPKGYDTWIEQGGVNLSGGQKQRLCIARALLKKPKILILDDSTSAVDTATERRIREAFRTELQDTTIILIAQRISSVQDADKILVMDDGRIVGEGTHSDLLHTCDTYREIVYSQQREGESQCQDV